MLVQLSEQLQNESFSLLSLCGNLKQFISSRSIGKTYFHETREFLDYIIQSLGAIEEFVRGSVKNPPGTEDLIKARLKDFGQIRTAVSWLYVLTKQSVDSDSLSLPFAVTTFLGHRAEKLLRPRPVSLVVVGSSNLMYYKCNLSGFRDLTRLLAYRIPTYPVLEDEIGILMFPYCAAREVLINCSLFHELGHYVYETAGLSISLSRRLSRKLGTFITSLQQANGHSLPESAWMALGRHVLAVMLKWADEMFADVFAVRVLGPAFHFAYIELEQVIPTATLRNTFSDTHPADDYRFKIHWRWLKNDGWDSELSNRTPFVSDNLSKCEAYNLTHFAVSCGLPTHLGSIQQELHKWMLQEFDSMVVQRMENAVSDVLGPDFRKPIRDFSKKHELVVSYLEHGVVPSTLYDKKGRYHYPSPTTVLNSGYFFYFGGMKNLLLRLKDHSSPVENRIAYEKRLGNWLGKAIEDWHIRLKTKKDE